MREQFEKLPILDRIEKKIDDLAVSVEHRLTNVETTQRGIKWFIGVVVTATTIITVALVI